MKNVIFVKNGSEDSDEKNIRCEHQSPFSKIYLKNVLYSVQSVLL